MYCSNCGEKLKKENNICSACGNASNISRGKREEIKKRRKINLSDIISILSIVLTLIAYAQMIRSIKSEILFEGGFDLLYSAMFAIIAALITGVLSLILSAIGYAKKKQDGISLFLGLLAFSLPVVALAATYF